MRSSTIASYSTACAIQSASSPVRETSAAWPASTSPRRRRLAIFTLVLDDENPHALIVAAEMRAG